MLSIVINLLLAFHVLVSLLIIFVVLMQRPKNEGLGAAFGGGVTENIFGAQTTSVLQKFTRVLGGLFFALTLILSVLYAHQANGGSKTDIQKQLSSVPAPAAPLPGATASASPEAAAVPGASASASPAAASSAAPSASPSSLPLAPAASATPASALSLESTAPTPSAVPVKPASPANGGKNDGAKH